MFKQALASLDDALVVNVVDDALITEVFNVAWLHRFDEDRQNPRRSLRHGKSPAADKKTRRCVRSLG